jgi:hypothetical protein
VIAENICTDAVRRRSHLTLAENLGLATEQSDSTSEDVVLADEDAKMATLALKRLSPRHRQVLAMREAGWTYQQIAEHEDVGVGTVETLLWRARQALKRQFVLLSEGRKAVAWFLVACAAVVRRITERLRSSGAVGRLHDAIAAGGVATGGAAVAVTFVALPIVTDDASDAGPVRGEHPAPTSAPAPRTAVVASRAPRAQPPPVTPTTQDSATPTTQSSSSTIGNTMAPAVPPAGPAVPASTPAAPVGAASSGVGTLVAGPTKTVNVVSGTTGGVAQTVSGATRTVNSVAGGVTSAVSGATETAGNIVTGTLGTVAESVNGAVVSPMVQQTVNGVLGH